MCFYYDETPEFFSESFPKVRSPHKCVACRRLIPAGEMCNHYSGKQDGEFYSSYVCGECVLTIFNIHLLELRAGCAWHESWCQPYDLMEYCENSGFERSTFEEGQQYVVWKRESERKKREEWKLQKAAN